MNLMLAIDIPGTVKASLAEQLEPLVDQYADLQWVDPQHYHITLFNFADKYSEETLKKKIENITYATRSFYLYSSVNGLFMKNNLTFYAGFLKSHPIVDLVKGIKRELAMVDDLKFFPHLTVAKYRIPSKQQYLLLKKKWLKLKIDIEFEVTQITLYESVIEKNVPIYTPKATFPLLQRTDY
ncbi:RNA 2',3'-cyclic phosphodiesterase [Candidatus Microgenomates bacterium]|nr:RNA 2',3'-cyclic phosphodiesterase [Candidatus Microgenomates bacterium]